MTTHKFGIRVPTSAAEAYAIDKETGTDYWTKSIEKEMTNVKVVFTKWKERGVIEARSQNFLSPIKRLDVT